MYTGDLEKYKDNKIIIERIYFPPENYSQIYLEEFWLKNQNKLSSITVNFV